MATMADHKTIEHVQSILEQETKEHSQYHLVTDMLQPTRGIEGRFEQILFLVMKLKRGFLEGIQ